jgi:chromosomal replication initiation ATPase DnaA
MDEKYSQLWQKLSAALKPQVSPDTFKRWFSAVKLVQATDEAFTFRVPNNIYQFWIESNHMAALQEVRHGFGRHDEKGRGRAAGDFEQGICPR